MFTMFTMFSPLPMEPPRAAREFLPCAWELMPKAVEQSPLALVLSPKAVEKLPFHKTNAQYQCTKDACGKLPAISSVPCHIHQPPYRNL